MNNKTELDPRWGKPDPTHDPWLLANFNTRPDDVLITTAPKAGTTWMQNILHQLRSGGDPGFDSIDAAVPWLELPRAGLSHTEVLKGYESMASPRIFKTHCTHEQQILDRAREVLETDCLRYLGIPT